MPASSTEKAYEKHAWMIPFAIGLLFLPTALQNAFGIGVDAAPAEKTVGMDLNELRASDPGSFELVMYYVRFSGLADLAFAFLIMAISITAFKRGERWSWYAFWSLPAFFVGSTAIVLTTAPPHPEVPFLMTFLILGVFGLLLPYRKFFPGKQI